MPLEINLYDLIFKMFLGLSKCGPGGGWGCITGEFTHDFVFSLFLPHIVLATFLFLLFRNLGHKGLETLLGIGGYIFIVQMGFYPLFASLTLWWMLITIGLGAYFFIVAKIFPPAKSGSLFRGGKAVGKWISKERRRGMSEEKLLAELKQRAKTTNDPEERKEILRAISELERR